MKKFIKAMSLLAASAMLFGFAGCSSDSSGGSSTVALEKIDVNIQYDEEKLSLKGEGENQYYELALNNEYSIVPVFTPENVTDKTVDIEVADESAEYIAYENGKLSAKKVTAVSDANPNGIALLTVSPRANKDMTEQIAVKVVVKVPTKIEFASNSSISLEKDGEENAPALIFTPKDVSDKSVTWSSENDEVAKVDPATGKVTGMKVGKANITATSVAAESIKASYEVEVVPYVYKIDENDIAKGFVEAAAGTKVNTANVTGYSGSGYLDNPAYVIYSINSPVAQTVKMRLRYAHWGWTYQVKAAYVVINGVGYKDPSKVLYGNQKGKVLADTNYIEIPLVEGENQIRLMPVAKGTVLPEYTEDLGYGIIYPNGEKDKTDAANTTNVAGPCKADGMIPNMDYLEIVSEEKLSKGDNTLSFIVVNVNAENNETGSVVLSPAQDFFTANTQVTVTATPATGYRFDCWYGNVGANTIASNNAEYNFSVTGETSLVARFVPDGAESQTLEGYATVSDDEGTKYTVTGGFGGTEITLTTLADLTTYKSQISGSDPYIIHVAARITTDPNASEHGNASLSFDLGSNKTLIGVADQDYGFKNIEVKITGKNVIVKNLHFGDVIGDDTWAGKGNDAMAIKGGQHVWIDHCEFSSSLQPRNNDDGSLITFDESKFAVDLEGENTTKDVKWAKDFYDGLLDISEEARFISVSNSYFHDHWKACLCGGSNDDAATQPKGSQVRLTMYNNYFENIHARQPLFRFGKAHVYSSYFKGVEDGSSTGIEVRAESEVYVDDCYFEGLKAGREVGSWNSSKGLGPGTWVVENCTGTSASSNNTTYLPPYTWTKTSADDSKTNLPGTAGIEK